VPPSDVMNGASSLDSSRDGKSSCERRHVNLVTFSLADEMTAGREREPRSPQSAASPRRMDSHMAPVTATEVPAPSFSTARAVMESFGFMGGDPTGSGGSQDSTRAVLNAGGGTSGDAARVETNESDSTNEPFRTRGTDEEPSSRAGLASFVVPSASDGVEGVPEVTADARADDFDAGSVERTDVSTSGSVYNEKGECRICLTDEASLDLPLCAPCKCDGSVRVVHVACLTRWCAETGATSCELCAGDFPNVFVDAGSGFRARARVTADAGRDEQRLANERLDRLLRNFQLTYGRPANRPSDFAVINLNAVLEAEAFARRRSRTRRDGDSDDRSGDPANETEPELAELGARVVVIDADGRAVTLNTRSVGAGGLARTMLEGEAALDEDDDSENERHPPGTRPNRGRRAGRVARGAGLNVPFGGSLDSNERDTPHARLRADIARVYVSAQFRFWLKATLAALCVFLALYAMLFAAAATSPGGGTAVFVFRVFGFALPLMLIARVAFLYRRHRERQFITQLDEVFVLRDAEASRGERRRDGVEGNAVARPP